MNPDIIIKLVVFLGRSVKQTISDHRTTDSTEEEPHDIGWEYFNTGCNYQAQKDYAQAAKYFRLGADRGIASAQFNLGNRYALGQGVAQDDEQAAKWYQLAADQGHTKAQAFLALRYAGGSGVPKDGGKAWELLKAAVKSAF